MKSLLKTALAGATASLALCSAASAALIFTDSFEQPAVSSWAVFQTGVGDAHAWSVDFGAGIEVQNEALGIVPAHDGAQYLELDSDNRRGGTAGDTNTGMTALVDFVAGRTYEISFAYRPRTATANDNIIELYALDAMGGIAGGQLLATANETTSSLSDWTVISVLFTALAGQNAIGFAAAGLDNSLGGFLDSVSVSEVPLPAALPMFGAGAAMLARLRRRRKTA